MVNGMKSSGNIYLGIGGWNFEPWRGVFYPDELPQAKELDYAASKLTAIEINATYYGSQKPESFRKWAARRRMASYFPSRPPASRPTAACSPKARDSVKRFLNSGVTELGDRLGPLLWQFAPTKKFDEADFRSFLELLPEKQDGLTLRHVVEVRHDSFRDAGFIALMREFNVAVVCAEHATYPGIADVTVGLRLSAPAEGQGHDPDRLSAEGARRLGGALQDLRVRRRAEGPRSGRSQERAESSARDVFAYVIHEGKVRAPAAAMALIERVK